MFEFKDIPAKPPRSLKLLPGLNCSSMLDKSDLFSMAFICLIILVIPISMLLTIQKSSRLPFINMTKADGIVREMIADSDCNKKKLIIHYQFKTMGNRTHYGEYTVSNTSVYSSLNVGDSLPIIYNPKDPGFNGIEGELGKNEPSFFPFISILFIIVLIITAVQMPNIMQFLKARSIFKKGIITNGRIVFVSRKKLLGNNKGLSNQIVSYRFETLDGKTIDAKMPTDNDWLTSKLEIGSSVTVVYIEGKPKKSIILDFYYG